MGYILDSTGSFPTIFFILIAVSIAAAALAALAIPETGSNLTERQ